MSYVHSKSKFICNVFYQMIHDTRIAVCTCICKFQELLYQIIGKRFPEFEMHCLVLLLMPVSIVDYPILTNILQRKIKKLNIFIRYGVNVILL